MRVTRFTDLGMRVLLYLHGNRGARQSAAPITVAEIAAQFDVPANHLVKAVGRLAKMGLVDATRGRNGGVRLSEGAGRARLGQVMRGLEGDDALIDCEGLHCALRGNCRLRGALHEALEAFYHALDGYTLADACDDATSHQVQRMHLAFRAVTTALQ
ncbi:Rrf2 family transcriptional regulator [Robbsia sp. KACC 23696]|uniref:RrF2 family transcriptional regulator n=1 Tax=Robbsia sp. KACC 23696 TaxID=3149231 RepID=UPI00325AE8E0